MYCKSHKTRAGVFVCDGGGGSTGIVKQCVMLPGTTININICTMVAVTVALQVYKRAA